MFGFHNRSFFKADNPNTNSSFDIQNVTVSKVSQSTEFFQSHFDPSEILSIEVTSYDRTEDVSPTLSLSYQDYYVFWIQVNTKKVQYKVCHRYNEFFSLYNYMKKKKGLSYKEFPKKNFLTFNWESKMGTRMKKLNGFLKFLLMKTKKGHDLPEFYQFLELQEFLT